MGAKPGYNLILADKSNTKNQTKAGAAWVSPEGYISIQLNPGVSIDYKDCERFYISLYPLKDDERPPSGGPPRDGFDDGNDIPF